MKKNWLHRMKYSFSPTYRIRVGAGISAIRSDKELEAVIAFCREELKDKEHMRLNPERRAIYKMTIKLYEQGKSDNLATYTKFHPFKPVQRAREYFDAHDFIEDHAGWYWS